MCSIINIFISFLANNQPNNTVPPLAVMAGNEMPITASQSSQNSIRPPFYNLNTVITSSTLGNIVLFFVLLFYNFILLLLTNINIYLNYIIK